MKPVAYREFRYAVSSEGQVINLANNLPLELVQNPNGYLKVSLANGDGTAEQVLVHRLVAKHYVPNPYDYPEVNHKDGDKTNNRATNLEWVSREGNAAHALRIGLRPGYMSADEKDSLLAEIFSGCSIRELASREGRGEESLAGMLRRRAQETGIKNSWDQLMKERRSAATILRNKTSSRGNRN